MLQAGDQRCFPKNFAKVLGTTILKNTCEQLKFELNKKFWKINEKTPMMELSFFLNEVAG